VVLRAPVLVGDSGPACWPGSIIVTGSCYLGRGWRDADTEVAKSHPVGPQRLARMYYAEHVIRKCDVIYMCAQALHAEVALVAIADISGHE
jgi:hypothetical protein